MKARSVFLTTLLCFAPTSVRSEEESSRPPLSDVHILVDKSERRLVVFRGQSIERIISISLGKNPEGPKERRGDGKTPEGEFQIAAKQSSARYYRGLRISYPRTEDTQRASRANVDPGGDIFIHGVRREAKRLEEAHRAFDWTDGCIAVTDAEMDDLWKLVTVGTKITIRP